MHKKLRIALPSFLATLMLITLSACSLMPSGGTEDSGLSTNVAELQAHWLPKLEGIESVVWEEGLLDGSSTEHGAHGFITLTPEQAEKYRSEYEERHQWLDSNVQIPQSLQDSAPDNQHWQSNLLFSMDMSDKAYVDIAMNDDGVLFFHARELN
ncbi:MAG: hypothetical protein IKS49_08615 [Actinomycetaceae bacterium]|nr:hypothetical protein [Actinomycetaceae bacterium]